MFNLYSKPKCQTLSQAFSMSTKIAPVLRPLLSLLLKPMRVDSINRNRWSLVCFPLEKPLWKLEMILFDPIQLESLERTTLWFAVILHWLWNHSNVGVLPSVWKMRRSYRAINNVDEEEDIG